MNSYRLLPFCAFFSRSHMSCCWPKDFAAVISYLVRSFGSALAAFFCACSCSSRGCKQLAGWAKQLSSASSARNVSAAAWTSSSRFQPYEVRVCLGIGSLAPGRSVSCIPNSSRSSLRSLCCRGIGSCPCSASCCSSCFAGSRSWCCILCGTSFHASMCCSCSIGWCTRSRSCNCRMRASTLTCTWYHSCIGHRSSRTWMSCSPYQFYKMILSYQGRQIRDRSNTENHVLCSRYLFSLILFQSHF